ncbi:MAG: PAS domain S-box protein [Proteobacteria bacterium]|nr:PAS domain S-box protein [Pseudomonadota bacterium]
MPFRPDPFLARFESLRWLRRERPWVGYAAAVAGVAAAVAIRAAIPGITAPFITFYPAVILAALVGGARPAALAIVLSALAADYFFIPPTLSFALVPIDLITLATYVAVAATLAVIVVFLNEAVDRLWRQADNVRFILDREPAGVILVDSAGAIQFVNRTTERLFGYRHDELLHQSIEMLVPDDVRGAHIAVRRAFTTAPESRAMGAGRDLNGRRKDGMLVPIELGLDPLARGEISGVMATVIDISERKAAERRQQILSNEIRHRGRNLLALVQAIAAQTIPLEARREFSGALDGLARTQDLFLETGTAPLAKIVEAELTPFSNRVTSVGCDVLLTPRAGQDFALIMHELTTNSAKHGALSVPEGRIAIAGRTDDDGAFSFLWEEHGGPPAVAPQRKGLGQRILQDVARSFCDTVEATYSQSGFRYELKMSLERIAGTVVDLAERRAVEAS